MSNKTFTVPNISCEHCTRTIAMELQEIEGVESVAASVDTQKVAVEWQDPATWEKIQSVLEEINYPPAE